MMNYPRIIFALIILLMNSCAKEDVIIDDPKSDPTQILYTSQCSISEIYWMPDNRHIILNDFCNGTLKYIEVQSGKLTLLSILSGYIVQRIFVSAEIPDYFFCLAHSHGSTLFDLFSYNTKTKESVLIKGGIKSNPLSSKYLVGGSKLAISGSPMQIIDLETGISTTIPLGGSAMSFSPDSNQLLYYSNSGARLYDFSCFCSIPFAINSYPQGVIWNSMGMFGYDIVHVNPYLYLPINLELMDFITGEQLKTFMNYRGGPWHNEWDTKIYIFSSVPNVPEEEALVLYSLDVKSGTQAIVFNAKVQSNTIIESSQFAVSPDGKKIAFVEKGNVLRGFW